MREKKKILSLEPRQIRPGCPQRFRSEMSKSSFGQKCLKGLRVRRNAVPLKIPLLYCEIA